MADLENGQCCSQGCDYFQAKGKNLRWFYEYVAAIIGIMLILFGLGSCLGCEACFDCAAVCDENCGCGLEECGRECDEISDQVFHCDGINCGDKRGVFSCDGKWDCSSCGGYLVFTVKVVYGDNNEYTVMEMEAWEWEQMSSLNVIYPDDKPEDYFKFKGYYTKKSGGTKYADENGILVKEITKSITLYAQYEELNAGEDYVIYFNAEPYFANPSPIDVVVGEKVYDTPDAPELDGLTFQGWYTETNGGGIRVAKPDETWTFHLVPFGHLPGNWQREVMLYAHYTVNTYAVRLHYDKGEMETITVEHDTLLSTVLQGKNNSMGNQLYYFGGWSLNENPELDEVVDGDIRIQETYDLYEIRREWITLTFDLGISQIQITRLREGETYQFNELIVPGTLQNLEEYMQNPSCNPGYEFEYWRIGMGQALPRIVVTEGMNTTISAKWKLAEYKIEYYVNGIYSNGSASNSGAVTKYSYRDQNMDGQNELTIVLWDFGEYGNNPNFVGWYIEGNPDTVFEISQSPYGERVIYLPKEIYGNLKLHAKFKT